MGQKSGYHPVVQRIARDLANEFLTEFQEMGIYNRGIKTRIGKTGNDYYGIIRQCALVNIPSVIVEHCHVDHPYDVVNLQSDDRLREFGERDARAVARYFGLTSIDNKTSYKHHRAKSIRILHRLKLLLQIW